MGWKECDWFLTNRSILGSIHPEDIKLVCHSLSESVRDSCPRRLKPRFQINPNTTQQPQPLSSNPVDPNPTYSMCDVTILLPEVEGRPVLVVRLVKRDVLGLNISPNDQVLVDDDIPLVTKLPAQASHL